MWDSKPLSSSWAFSKRYYHGKDRERVRQSLPQNNEMIVWRQCGKPIFILKIEYGFTPGIVWKQWNVTRFALQREENKKGLRCKWLAYGPMASV